MDLCLNRVTKLHLSFALRQIFISTFSSRNSGRTGELRVCLRFFRIGLNFWNARRSQLRRGKVWFSLECMLKVMHNYRWSFHLMINETNLDWHCLVSFQLGVEINAHLLCHFGGSKKGQINNKTVFCEGTGLKTIAFKSLCFTGRNYI